MKLVFASHNLNKVQEVKPLIPNFIDLLSLHDIHCHEEIKEDALTLEGNALLKAQYVYDQYGVNCFADDTGLEVEALNNQPGVFSARYAGPEKNDRRNVEKLLDELKDKSNRKAQFKTVFALIIEGKTKIFTGRCEGEILTAPRGDGGFGYDPVFKPQGYTMSFAEMSFAEKNKISHRAKALEKLIVYLQSSI